MFMMIAGAESAFAAGENQNASNGNSTDSILENKSSTDTSGCPTLNNDSGKVMKGYWMRFDDVADSSTLKSQNITDIFFLTRGLNGNITTVNYRRL